MNDFTCVWVEPKSGKLRGLWTNWYNSDVEYWRVRGGSVGFNPFESHSSRSLMLSASKFRNAPLLLSFLARNFLWPNSLPALISKILFRAHNRSSGTEEARRLVRICSEWAYQLPLLIRLLFTFSKIRFLDGSQSHGQTTRHWSLW